MLMRPIKAKTAVHGCHCPGDTAVCMRKVLTRPWFGVRVCHLLLLLFLLKWMNDTVYDSVYILSRLFTV